MMINKENSNRTIEVGKTNYYYSNDVDRFITPSKVVHLIEDVPTADVQEVKHGKWVHLGGDEWCCSECGYVITTEGSWDKPTGKYCTECGAKMDGGENE